MTAVERVHELRQAAQDSGAATPLRAGGPALSSPATAPARATNPLAGEGTTCAGRGSSLETASAIAGRGAFSKARFSMIALAVFARGGHWRHVARAAGIAPNLARAYGARLLIKSPHPRGRPAL